MFKSVKINIYFIYGLAFLIGGGLLYGVGLLLEKDKVQPARFGFGRAARPEEIKAWDIDVMPDGRGLPAGTGRIKTGLLIYQSKCASCHGHGDKASLELPGGPLFLDHPTEKTKTIGTYWPYATTIFDYVRRAMPYNAPGSLSNQEVYDLTAFLLFANKVIPENAVINQQSLPKIVMPAKKRYVTDNRRGGNEIR